MQLQQAVNKAFVQLSESLKQLAPGQYSQPCQHLFTATIGQHARHIIEMFQCLEQGYVSGTVNYEKRKRDQRIETEPDFALALLRDIAAGLDRPNIELTLEACYEDDCQEPVRMTTNYYREVAYNLEHTIHHMALIRVGLQELSQATLPEEFGVASSTLKYRKSCAQ